MVISGKKLNRQKGKKKEKGRKFTFRKFQNKSLKKTPTHYRVYLINSQMKKKSVLIFKYEDCQELWKFGDFVSLES